MEYYPVGKLTNVINLDRIIETLLRLILTKILSFENSNLRSELMKKYYGI